MRLGNAILALLQGGTFPLQGNLSTGELAFFLAAFPRFLRTGANQPGISDHGSGVDRS